MFVLAVLVINMVSILAILVSNTWRAWFLHSTLESGTFSTQFCIPRDENLSHNQVIRFIFFARTFIEEGTFSSLWIRPSTKARHNAFNIGLN